MKNAYLVPAAILFVLGMGVAAIHGAKADECYSALDKWVHSNDALNMIYAGKTTITIIN